MRHLVAILLMAGAGDVFAMSMKPLLLGPLIATTAVVTGLSIPRSIRPGALVSRQIADDDGSLSPGWDTLTTLGAVGAAGAVAAGSEITQALPEGWNYLNAAATNADKTRSDSIHPPMTKEEEKEMLKTAAGKTRWCIQCRSKLYGEVWVSGAEPQHFFTLYYRLLEHGFR